MSETTRDSAYGAPQVATEGPFKGWRTWGFGLDPYESLVGPFYLRDEADGRRRAAFQPEQRHLNGAGAVHGGCLASFADFALFALAGAIIDDATWVTVNLHTDFVGAGGLDGWIEADGRLVRATGSLAFVQGQMTQRGQPILAFSGLLKRVRATA